MTPPDETWEQQVERRRKESVETLRAARQSNPYFLTEWVAEANAFCACLVEALPGIVGSVEVTDLWSDLDAQHEYATTSWGTITIRVNAIGQNILPVTGTGWKNRAPSYLTVRLGVYASGVTVKAWIADGQEVVVSTSTDAGLAQLALRDRLNSLLTYRRVVDSLVTCSHLAEKIERDLE